MTNEESARRGRTIRATLEDHAPSGAFDGVPTVVKEGLDAIGLPNSAQNYRGSAAHSVRDPHRHRRRPSVERLKDASAIGKTSQADYGIFIFA